MSDDKNHITIAKIIRKELKARGINGKVQAKFQADFTVSIQVKDVAPDAYKSLKEFVNNYRYNPRADDTPENHQAGDSLPKVKYLFISNNFSEGLYQKALDYVTSKVGLPALRYSETKPNDPIAIVSGSSYTVGEVLVSVLSGLNCHTFHYWEESVQS